MLWRKKRKCLNRWSSTLRQFSKAWKWEPHCCHHWGLSTRYDTITMVNTRYATITSETHYNWYVIIPHYKLYTLYQVDMILLFKTQGMTGTLPSMMLHVVPVYVTISLEEQYQLFYYKWDALAIFQQICYVNDQISRSVTITALWQLLHWDKGCVPMFLLFFFLFPDWWGDEFWGHRKKSPIQFWSAISFS